MPRKASTPKNTSTSITITLEMEAYIKGLGYGLSPTIRAFIRIMMNNPKKFPALKGMVESAMIENGDDLG